MSINLNNLLEQQVEREREEKDTLSCQKNEDVTSTEEATDESGEHEEKSPPTSTNLASDNQQLERNESGREEKIPSTTDDNSSLSTTDLNTSVEPSKLEMKFTPDYNEKEPVFRRVIGEISNDGLVNYDKLQQGLVSTGQLFAGEAVLMIMYCSFRRINPLKWLYIIMRCIVLL